jgi:GTP-binding protein
MTQDHTPVPPSPSPSHDAAAPAATPSPTANPALGTPDVKAMHGWLHTARFLTTAPQLEHLPALDLPEIAFVGRSNAGKSTCINTLTQQKRLAFASKTPGRTQSINLFSLGKQGIHDAVLADLPGYGYAAVPREAKLRWQRVMGNYLLTRQNLTGVVLLIDPRLGMTELDEILLDVIRPRVQAGLKFLVLLTKSDKLSRSEAAKALSIARLQSGGGEARLFSALKKQGLDDVAQLLWQWAHEPAKVPKQTPAGLTPSTEPDEEEPEALD